MRGVGTAGGFEASSIIAAILPARVISQRSPRKSRCGGDCGVWLHQLVPRANLPLYVHLHRREIVSCAGRILLLLEEGTREQGRLVRVRLQRDETCTSGECQSAACCARERPAVGRGDTMRSRGCSATALGWRKRAAGWQGVRWSTFGILFDHIILFPAASRSPHSCGSGSRRARQRAGAAAVGAHRRPKKMSPYRDAHARGALDERALLHPVANLDMVLLVPLMQVVRGAGLCHGCCCCGRSVCNSEETMFLLVRPICPWLNRPCGSQHT